MNPLPTLGRWRVVFTGNTALDTETLNTTVAAWSGRALSCGDLIQAVEAIEARYKATSYFLAQAYFPPQKIRSASAILAWAGKKTPNPADNSTPRFWFNLGYA